MFGFDFEIFMREGSRSIRFKGLNTWEEGLWGHVNDCFVIQLLLNLYIWVLINHYLWWSSKATPVLDLELLLLGHRSFDRLGADLKNWSLFNIFLFDRFVAILVDGCFEVCIQLDLTIDTRYSRIERRRDRLQISIGGLCYWQVFKKALHFLLSSREHSFIRCPSMVLLMHPFPMFNQFNQILHLPLELNLFTALQPHIVYLLSAWILPSRLWRLLYMHSLKWVN